MSLNSKIDNTITIRPAKRILVLYALALAALLLLLGLGLDHLHYQFELDRRIGNAIWKSSILIGLSFLLYCFLWRITSVYTVSSECVTSSTGILSRKHIRIPLNRIVDYQIVTPLIERVLGLGSFHVNTAGDEEMVMKLISAEAIELAVVKLNKLLNKEQRRSDTPAASSLASAA